MKKTGKLLVLLATIICLAAIVFTVSLQSSAAYPISRVTVSQISDCPYTGKAVCPSVTVKYGAKALTKGTNYTVAYKNNINTGTATLTISGKGIYTGTKYISFNIVSPAVNGLTYKNVTQTSAYLYWSASPKATGYQVYKYDAASKTYKFTKATTAPNFTLSSLKAGSSNLIRVRPYNKLANGKLLYGTFTGIKVMTAPENVSDIVQSASTAVSAVAKWKASAGASGYQVYLYNSATRKYVYKASVKTPAVTLTGLTPALSTYIKVRAYSTINKVNYFSALSAAAQIKTLPKNFVTKIVCENITDNSVTLKWNSVKGASLYRIFALAKGGRWTAVAVSNTNSKVLTGLKECTDYSFRVVTCVKSGNVLFNSVAKYTVAATTKLPVLNTSELLLNGISQKLNAVKATNRPAFEMSSKVTFNDVKLKSPSLLIDEAMFSSLFSGLIKDESKALPAVKADSANYEAELKKYMASLPVCGSKYNIRNGLDPNSIDMTRSSVKDGKDSYDITMTLNNETFNTLPELTSYTSHGKVFDILYKNYIDSCLDALKNNEISGVKVSMSFSSFKTTYHDSSVTITVDKITGKVIKAVYDMNVKVEVGKFKMTAGVVQLINSDVSFDVNSHHNIVFTY